MTVRRYRVDGTIPEGHRDLFRAALQENAFRERPIPIGAEGIDGWVLIHNLLDTSFEDMNRWLYNQYAVFALRIDKVALPQKLFRATLQKRCEAWCQSRGAERCPASVKSELKEALETEWLKRSLPKVAVLECCWNIADGYFLLHSMSETAADRVRKRFYATFGLKLLPWSPLEWLSDRQTVEGLLAAAPASFHSDPGAD